MTLITNIKNRVPTSATILSVHGSARTAKFHAIREIRKRHEHCIWKVVEHHYKTTFHTHYTTTSTTGKQIKRIIAKRKYAVFHQLVTKNQHRFNEQISEIQKLD